MTKTELIELSKENIIIVKLRNDEECLFLLDRFIDTTSSVGISCYDINLLETTYGGLDVVKVYTANRLVALKDISDAEYTLIWEREEIKELTIEKVIKDYEDRNNCKIKIIKEND